MTNKSKIDPTTGQFIDPMFAVIIAAAVSETVVLWAKNSDMPSAFHIFVVFLGYVNLLLSWFGYHKSVQARPILGGVRFVLTVILLPAYLMAIIMYTKPFLYTAIAYALIFFLWSVWEYFKFHEHGEKAGFWKLQSRFFNALVYAALIYLIICDKIEPEYRNYVLADYSEPIAAFVILLAIAILRLSKSAATEGTFTAMIASGLRGYAIGRSSKPSGSGQK